MKSDVKKHKSKTKEHPGRLSKTTVTAEGKLKKDLAASYNRFKTFEGKVYTGAKVGRKQKWYYDKGEWKEQKVTPDQWEIHYEVTKRRAGHAPEGSGAPVGTEYHWYILAHQLVKKLNANDYSTEMTGLKYKLSHKRFDKENWASSTKAQRKQLIKIFQQMIKDLEKEGEQEEMNKKQKRTEKQKAKKKTIKSKKKIEELEEVL